ncbi:MAG: polysaccharide deacetylase family protein [Oligoflexia bacterium]|nr:polysaccharide deacetylase family protein [Oligoflexia bacterium]
MDFGWTQALRAGMSIGLAVAVLSCAGAPAKRDLAANGAAVRTETAQDPAPKPASSEDPDRLEATFQMLLKDAAPLARFQGYLGRVLSIYFVAESVVRDFDRELEALGAEKKKVPLLKMESYRKAQAMWLLTMRERKKLDYLYRRLLQAERSGSEREKATARRVRVELDNYLFRKSGSERIALHDLMVAFNEIRMELGLRPHRIAEPRELRNLLRNFRKEIARRADQERARNIELNQEAESLATEMAAGEGEGRTPQSDRVFPSPGKEGNITGGSLPQGTWALTYDDGPSLRHTPVILQNLKNNNMKATFFWLVENVSRHALGDVVQGAGAEGMARENHSWTHPNLPKLGAEALKHEIVDSTSKLAELYGDRPRFFRCPYGAGLNVPRVRELIAEQEMIHVFWNVDSLDWQDKNAASVFERVKKQMAVQGSGVVLFHDIHSQSVEASRMLMEWSQSQGFRWVTMREALDLINSIEPPVTN